ncbi:MAG: Uma2 family endonuclease [Acidobacteria bacterium]|nr:Uma2 family endonuclease [Acidobacteriota bacterium]
MSAAQAQLKRKYTMDEYIELLKNSEERFEYFDGEVFSMAVGKPSHSIIAANVSGELRSLLKGRYCQTASEGLAVKTELEPPFRMPDVTIICGEMQTEDFKGITMVLNPLLICEVLSPSTKDYDREGKFLVYQAIESFKEYLLVERDRPHVTRYVRQPDNQWLRADVIGLESSIKLESLGVTLPLSEIYRMIQFPALGEEAAS